MALKCFGQAAPGATTLTDLYTVPNGKSAVVGSVVVCNRSAAPVAFRLAVAVAGEADASKQYLYYDKPVPANDSVVATIGLALAAGDVIRVYAASADLSFSAFGSES